MKKHKVIYSIFIINIIILSSCIFDFNESAQVSLDINESKSKKVFIAEYHINSIRCYDKNYKFPINSVWVEKEWRLALDTNKNETYKTDTSSYNLVFKLNNRDTLITNANFYEDKWVMFIDSNESNVGTDCGMINIDLTKEEIKDTFSLSIYKLNNPPDFKTHRVKLFNFEIVRK